MNIQDVVDLDRFCYVCPFNWTIHTDYGDFDIVRGWMSDGATGVADKDLEAFFAHDRLYVFPEIAGETVTKAQCDHVYGEILLKRWHWIRAYIRPLGLWMFGRKPWARYRAKDDEDPLWWMHGKDGHIVPHVHNWKFPSFELKDAVWVGDQTRR